MLGEYIKFCLLNEMQSINNKPQIFNFGFCELLSSITPLSVRKIKHSIVKHHITIIGENCGTGWLTAIKIFQN